MVCGFDQIRWQCLRRAISALTTKQLPTPSLRERAYALYPITFESTLTSTTLLLGISRGRKCTDPRDKIYGMLSIAGPIFSSLVTPSYTKSAGEVYHDVFSAYASQVQRLELLLACDSSERHIDCPSWVPDFSSERETYALTGFQLASGVSASEIRSIDKGLLRVTGILARCRRHW